MSRVSTKIKKQIIEQVLSMSELENIMEEYDYRLIENDDTNEDNIVKFTNFSSQIWIYCDIDSDGNILVSKVSEVNRTEFEPTRVEPFRTYEDLETVMNYFKDNGYYNHWITGWLMVALGRRVGDTISLKWSDLFKKDGTYRKRLTQLKEEKTGKKLAPILNGLAKSKIEEYIKIMGINPMAYYTEKLVNTSNAAFRKMVKKAVGEVGLTYDISTHSFRKYWANTIYKLHPQDADNLMIIQTMLGHSDIMTTKIYINEIDNKQDKYNEDYSNYMIAKGKGENVEISNSPMITMKADDFRKILGMCFDSGKNNEDKFETIDKIIGIVENKMV